MSEKPCPRKTTGLLITCVAGIVLFAPGLWSCDLWSPREPMYAEIGHEIAASGNWLNLRVNGEPYYNKPPVFFWLETLCIKAFGLQTASVRLPSFVLGVGGLVLCYLIARRLGIDPLMSSLILATCWRFPRASQRANLDVPLVFFMLLAFYLYLVSLEANRRGWAYSLGAALAACAAMMVKGPVALLLLGCAIFPRLLWHGRWKEVLHWKWLVAVLIIACAGGAWLLALTRLEGEQFINTLLGREVASRFSADWERPKPIYHYFTAFTRDFIPWIIFFPMALAHAWKHRDQKVFEVFLWFATVFIILTLIPARSVRYIIPLYPVAAMFVAAYLSDRKAWSWRTPRFRAIVGLTAIGLLCYSVAYDPHRNLKKSPMPLVSFLEAEGATQEDVLWYRSYEPGVAFYAGFPKMRVVQEMSSLDEHPHVLLIAKEDALPEAINGVPPVKRFRIGRKRYAVFRTDQPGAAKTP